MSAPKQEFTRWRKSSYSGTNANCVEVSGWRKSSYSGSNANCVEVSGLATGMAVRDSKFPEAGHLDFGAREWALLATLVRS